MRIVLDIFSISFGQANQFADTPEFNTPDTGWSLKGHPDTHFRPFGDREMGDILAHENNFSFFYLIFRETHNSHEQRAFPNAVRTEEDNGFTLTEVQIKIL